MHKTIKNWSKMGTPRTRVRQRMIKRIFPVRFEPKTEKKYCSQSYTCCGHNLNLTRDS